MYADLDPSEDDLASRLAPLIDTTTTTDDNEDGTPRDPSSLLGRLWQTKMVDFPQLDGLEPETVAEPEEDDEDDEFVERQPYVPPPPNPVRQGDSVLRPTCLFINSDQIQKLDTKAILRLLLSILTVLPLEGKIITMPFGLEWVNDTSVTVLSKTPEEAAAAFEALTNVELDDSLAFHAIETSVPLEAPFYIRMALASDTKAKDAAKKSLFYREQQRKNRERKPYDRPPHRSRRDMDDLDAELDSYRNGSKEHRKQNLDDDLEEYARGRDGRGGGGGEESERERDVVLDYGREE